MTQHNINNYIN